jgi:hypothetical protein
MQMQERIYVSGKDFAEYGKKEFIGNIYIYTYLDEKYRFVDNGPDGDGYYLIKIK